MVRVLGQPVIIRQGGWSVNPVGRGVHIQGTWTPKACKIMALMAVIMGLGLLSYMFWWFRYIICDTLAPGGFRV